MSLLEKLRRDSNEDLEADIAHEILDRLEASREKISPQRVIFASAVTFSLLLVSIFTLVIVVPYDRVSVDVVYRQGGSGHVILAQLDNQGSREIGDISLSLRFIDYEGSELGRTDFFLDTLPAHREEYGIEILLEYSYYNGRGDERWSHEVGNWTMELFTDRAPISIF
jgi:hypothetical protein